MQTKSKPTFSGRVFNSLTAIRFSRLIGKSYYWIFQCECGVQKEIQRGSVTSGTVKSCGCMRKKRNATRSSLAKNCLYETWRGMIRRCHNPNHKDFHLYGARGIAVCNRWKNSLEHFTFDMGEKPSPSHSIDRIDNNGNYDPSNCRWATPLQQSNNQRTNRKITYLGESKTMAEWSRTISQNPFLVRDRIRSGMNEIEAITKPSNFTSKS